MDKFKILQSLIASLSTDEKYFCSQYFKMFSSDKVNDDKIIKFFDLLCQKNELGEMDLCKILYSKRKTNLFARLQVRLRDNILDVLTIEQSLRREGKRNERSIQRVLLRRKLNHADILITRNQFEVAQSILEAVEETGEKHELFDEVLTSLRLQLQSANSQKNFDKVQLLQLDAHYCCQRIAIITTAEHLLVSMREEGLQDISIQLQKLYEYERDSPSVTLSFFIIGVNIEEARRKGNYKAVGDKLTKQLVLVSNYPALKDWQLIGKIYLELANNAVLLDQRDKVREYLMDAERWVKDVGLIEECERLRRWLVNKKE